jgi:hypothetical protein
MGKAMLRSMFAWIRLPQSTQVSITPEPKLRLERQPSNLSPPHHAPNSAASRPNCLAIGLTTSRLAAICR